MWPHCPNKPPQSQHSFQNQSQQPYNPSSQPSSFLPPPAHHILSLPTPSAPGFSQYSSNPFNPPALPPALKNSTPRLQPSSAFYTPGTYRDHTDTHATPMELDKLRAPTPQPHVHFKPTFGVVGFTPAAVNQLAYSPFEETRVRSEPQSWGIQNRPFGFQPKPMFPQTVFPATSRWNPVRVLEERKREMMLRPSERVRRELEGVDEREEEMEGILGQGARRKRKREGEREMLPSEKVRRRLQGLGPREAWDPDSP